MQKIMKYLGNNPLSRKASQVWKKILRQKDAPEKISKGYALGVFLGTTPFIGFKVLIALIITSILKWNKATAVIGVYHINSVTGPFFYTLAFYVGTKTLGLNLGEFTITKLNWEFLMSLFDMGIDMYLAFLVGGLVLGIPMTAAAYFISLFILKKKLPEAANC